MKNAAIGKIIKMRRLIVTLANAGDKIAQECPVMGRSMEQLRMYQAAEMAWKQGLEFIQDHPNLTASCLYDFSQHLAMSQGFRFGSPHCGFQVKTATQLDIAGPENRYLIQPGNDTLLRMRNADGSKKVWLYRITFRHKNKYLDAWYQRAIIL